MGVKISCPVELPSVPVKHINEACTWLSEIFRTHYKAYVDIKRWHTEQEWNEIFEMLDVLEEERDLKQAQSKFIRALSIRGKPTLFTAKIKAILNESKS